MKPLSIYFSVSLYLKVPVSVKIVKTGSNSLPKNVLCYYLTCQLPAGQIISSVVIYTILNYNQDLF